MLVADKGVLSRELATVNFCAHFDKIFDGPLRAEEWLGGHYAPIRRPSLVDTIFVRA
jgi:hypothetical protein